MTATSSHHSTTHWSAPTLIFTPIELSRGIRGEILTECRLPTRHCPVPRNLPSFTEWRPWLAQLVTDPAALPGYATLKYSKSGEVFRARFPGPGDPHAATLDVACRYFPVNETQKRRKTQTQKTENGCSFLRFCVSVFLRFFRPSRASRNLLRARRLLQVGIDTPVPLAWIERTTPPRSSWLVTEFVANVVDLDQIVLTLLPRMDRRARRKARNGVVDAVVELLARLDRAGLHHRDLKASNILMTNWEGRETRPRPMLVDLDGLHPRRWWDRRRRWQPLIRLAASLRDYPGLTRTDFARFLHRYLSQIGRPKAEWKTHFRRLTRDATEYVQRSQLRKTRKLDGFTGA